MADRGVNRVILLGRLACEPERKETAGGSVYAWLKLAVNTEQPRKGQGENNQKTEYVRCQLWNPDGVLSYLGTGRQLHIEGRLEGYQSGPDKPLVMSVNVDRLILTGDKPGRASGGYEAGERMAIEIEELERKLMQLEGKLSEREARVKDLEAEIDAWRANSKPASEKRVKHISEDPRMAAAVKSASSSKPQTKHKGPVGKGRGKHS